MLYRETPTDASTEMEHLLLYSVQVVFPRSPLVVEATPLTRKGRYRAQLLSYSKLSSGASNAVAGNRA